MKKALIITTDKYPDGDAGAVRAHVFAKMLQSLGYEPTVIGMGPSNNFKYNEYDDVLYTSFRYPSSSIVSRIKGRLRFYKRLNKFLLNTPSWDLIFVSLVSRKSMEILKCYAKKKSIPIIHDSVEWYSPEQFSIGKFHPSYIAMDRRNRKYVDESMRVIAISSYLEKHFKSRGILTTRIPVIMDTQQMPCDKKTKENKLVFTYAGSPGKKDYLDVVIKAFAQVLDFEDGLPYELRLIGVTKAQLQTICDVQDIEKIGECLQCYGRVPREQVLKNLEETDFTVLIRSEDQRYAKAGFPTKFVESLATGTPVIANITSDLGMFLNDGENGYVVKDSSAEALCEVLKVVLQTSFEQRKRIQKNARKTAVDQFEYKKYTDILNELIVKN